MQLVEPLTKLQLLKDIKQEILWLEETQHSQTFSKVHATNECTCKQIQLKRVADQKWIKRTILEKTKAVKKLK